MRVVAGKADETPTPILSDEMTEVVFSPYWYVPTSILRKETIPAILRDSGYLDRNELEVVLPGAGEVRVPEQVRRVPAEAAMHAGREQHVALKRRIPVYIVYATAWVDEAGRLNFANDLYGHDARQRAAQSG